MNRSKSAIIFTLLLFVTSYCYTQDSNNVQIGLTKSKSTAIILSSVFPGLGHFYVERPWRGTFYLVTESAVTSAMIYILISNLDFDFDVGNPDFGNSDFRMKKISKVKLAKQNSISDKHSFTDKSNLFPLLMISISLKTIEIIDLVNCVDSYNNEKKGVNISLGEVNHSTLGLNVVYRF